jgi:hypothetical protein
MAAHRFANLLNDHGTVATIDASQRFGGFMPCPQALAPALVSPQVQWQQQLYQRALAEAQAVVRPAITERVRIDFPN